MRFSRLISKPLWGQPFRAAAGLLPCVSLAANILLLSTLCSAAVVDRAALVIGKTVYTESEVEQEARLTDLESGKPLDLSVAARKQAANQLIDQELLRREMAATGFQPPATDPDALLRSFSQKRYATTMQLREALTRYGVTEDALVKRLAWEVTLLAFTDQRFKPLAMLSEPESANRAENPAQPLASAVDQQMDQWLQQQRADTRIVFIPEAFQ